MINKLFEQLNFPNYVEFIFSEAAKPLFAKTPRYISSKGSEPLSPPSKQDRNVLDFNYSKYYQLRKPIGEDPLPFIQNRQEILEMFCEAGNEALLTRIVKMEVFHDYARIGKLWGSYEALNDIESLLDTVEVESANIMARTLALYCVLLDAGIIKGQYIISHVNEFIAKYTGTQLDSVKKRVLLIKNGKLDPTIESMVRKDLEKINLSKSANNIEYLKK